MLAVLFRICERIRGCLKRRQAKIRWTLLCLSSFLFSLFSCESQFRSTHTSLPHPPAREKKSKLEINCENIQFHINTPNFSPIWDIFFFSNWNFSSIEYQRSARSRWCKKTWWNETKRKEQGNWNNLWFCCCYCLYNIHNVCDCDFVISLSFCRCLQGWNEGGGRRCVFANDIIIGGWGCRRKEFFISITSHDTMVVRRKGERTTTTKKVSSFLLAFFRGVLSSSTAAHTVVDAKRLLSM